MSGMSKNVPKEPSSKIEIKSKLDAAFRRFSLDKSKITNFEEFYAAIEKFHKLHDIPFVLFYTDPIQGDLLPINNTDNFTRAINYERPFLRLIVQKKGENCEEINGYGNSGRRKRFLGQYLLPSIPKNKPHISISLPEDFRQVSSIIDVDVVPETCRRVKLVKHGSDKPLGFYIRDGTSVQVTPRGFEKVPGIFISRLVPGGLAEMTGLLAVNDEVIEVNGIEVAGKTLDQTTDMMVANSSSLVITIRPANQSNVGFPCRGSIGHSSQMSHGSQHSNQSLPSDDDHLDDDEIRDYTSATCFEETTEKKSMSEEDGIVTL